MRFLTVAERELRAAARRKATYILRWTTGAGFFVLLIWLMWAMGALEYKNRVHDVFVAYSVMVFFYCLLVGAIRTADCISSERREGTLGLLFLTNLNSLEIIAGKLCSNALPTVYGLLAIFPMLALPLLMGGVTPVEFGRTMLALLDAILLSLGCGFMASVLCKRQFPAVALAMGLALVFGAGTLGAAAIIVQYKGSAWLVHGLSTVCPFYTIATATGGRIFKGNHYWLSLGNVAIFSLAGLGLATLRLARSWRDRAKSAPRKAAPSALQQSVSTRRSAGRAALRQRLLNLNPFYWLTARQQISSPIFMLIVVVLVFLTVFGTTPLFVKMIGSQNYRQVLGSLLAWLWTGLAIHVLTLYYSAMISSQALAEDKQNGALELIFATPVNVQTIGRGLWMAFRRRMLFPAIAVVMVHGHFLWLVMTMSLLDPPGTKLPPGTTQLQLFSAVMLNNPLGGRFVAWEFVLIVRVLVMILPLAVVLWFTLGWIGRWLGLRMKHPGFAPLVALALLVIPPTLVFSLLCYLADQAHLLQSNSRQWLPVLIWGAFAIALGHCAILCGWAARHLREDFRATVIGRFDVVRRTWSDRGRSLGKFSLRATAFAAVLALVVTGYFGCQNFRSRRAWAAFQTELKRKGQSLDLAAMLPPPVPDESNFARSKEFRDIIDRKNKPLFQMLDRMPDLDYWHVYQSLNPETHAWTSQRHASLEVFTAWLGVNGTSGVNTANVIRRPPVPGMPYSTPTPADDPTNNAELAPIVLKTLAPVGESLQSLAVAARRPAFQPTTNRTAIEILQAPQAELKALARLHFLFTLRSLASLETGRTADAGEDLLTSLRLVRLAQQSPDAASTTRAQVLLIRSFQPLWEGLDRHQWSDPQLATIQAELAQFNLLADFTNAVGRIVLANIKIWKAVPDATNGVNRLPDRSGNRNNNEWRAMPRAWWFDNCIQLYRVGEAVIGDVNVPGEKVGHNLEWNDLNDLPLDNESQQLLQTVMRYWQNNTPGHVTFSQTALNQARIAVALERHWLASQRYPKSLNELVPAYFTRIPYDVEIGRPLLYEPNTNGTYLLRALGQNHKSDRTNTISDDWLWAYPTNAPAGAQSP